MAGLTRLVSALGRITERWRSARDFPWIAAAFAMALALPSLIAGLRLDDDFHRTILLQKSPLCRLLGTPSEMFCFFRGDPDRTGGLVDVGVFPWWTDLTLKAEFLQALTVLTHRLDYTLWPDHVALMHAQSIGWLGAVVALAALFYRRILGATWVAVVAALLFAVDDARGVTVGFIANRNALVAATFGVAALIFHDQARRRGTWRAAVLAPLMLLAALLSKEEGIGTCAYLAAYGLFLDRSGVRRGVLALWPYLATVAAWRSVRTLLGYGLRNMDIYVDPITDLGRFSRAVIDRAPILLLGQWSPIPSDLGALLGPPAFSYLWWFSILFAGVLLIALLPLLRRDRTARFWAAGMVFSALPVCATLPMDRLLTFMGIGAFGLLAQFWEWTFRREDEHLFGSGRRRLAIALSYVFLVTHAVIAPLVSPFRAARPVGPDWLMGSLPTRTSFGPALKDQTLIVVNAPNPANANYLLLRRDSMGSPGPRFIRVLAPAIPSVAIKRLDERTLEVAPRGGYLRWVLDRVFRSERRPLELGEQIKLTGLTITITALTVDGRPAKASFRFDEPLESAEYQWICFRGSEFETFVPPAIGESLEIPFDWRAVITSSFPDWRSTAVGRDGVPPGESSY